VVWSAGWFNATLMHTLTIYILCHNRPDFAEQAIQSAINQSMHTFKLIVSDNSSNDEVERMVKRKFPSIRYVRRLPMLEPLEHFNRCMDEVETKYFCLFHDDDILGTNYVEELFRCIDKYPGAIAYGCNARIEKADRLEEGTSFRSLHRYVHINGSRNLAQRYFARGRTGIAPFPGYIYDRNLVDSLRFAADGGKYADVTWLLRLAMKAPMVWVRAPLMIYRIHESNDSNAESKRDRLKILGFLKRNEKIFGMLLLSDYRFFIYKKLMGTTDNLHFNRRRLASAFMRNQRILRYLRPDYYWSMLVRALAKWFT